MISEDSSCTEKPETRMVWAVCIISMAAMLALYAYYGEVGWWLLMATYLVAASEKSLRSDHTTFVIVAAIILIHQLVAVYNIFGTTLPGADSDAESFLVYAQNRGIEDIYPAISIDLYRNFLILVLSLGEHSVSLAIFSSVFAFTLSLLLFNRLITICGCQRLRRVMLLIFGLMPHVLVYTSVTLREPWQLLFFTGMVYYGISLNRESGLINLFMFMLCTAALALLHQVLLPFALLAAIIILLWPLRDKSLRKTLIGLFSVILVVSALAAAALSMIRSERITGVGILAQMSKLDGDDFLRQLKGYRAGIDKDTPRTSMNIVLDTSSFTALARSMPAMYLHYWFSPLPWQVANVNDLIATMLSLLRLGMMLVILWGFSVAKLDRKLQSLLITLFLLMCSTWFLGTTNYGQAIRHQVLSDWLLILSSGVALSSFLTRRKSEAPPQFSTHVHSNADVSARD